MRVVRSTAAATALLATCAVYLTKDVNAAALPCTTSETAQLDALAAPLGGLLRVCETDAGFALYPFRSFPASDKRTIVCYGRACPSVIYNLQQAALPTCTVNVAGTAMTPAEFLTTLCPTNGATNNNTTTMPPATTTVPPVPTVAVPSPGATTTTTPTTAPTTTPPGATDGNGSASTGSGADDAASSSIEEPPTATEAVVAPTKDPSGAATPAPTSAAAGRVGSTSSVVVLAAVVATAQTLL